MLGKMKVGLFPSPSRPSQKVKPIPGATEAVAYYPGCSLHSTSPEFNISTKAVCEALGLRLIEPHGWVCCGSTPAHRSNPKFGLKLPMENLSLFERSGFQEVTMPCAACFNHFKTVQYEMRQNEQQRRAMVDEIGYEYQDRVQVNTLVQTITRHVSKDTIAKKVKKSLENLRVVCYYGCLLTRPPQVTEAEHPENPVDMDELVAALGAQVLDWSYKTVCCGASHSLTRPDIVIKLSSNLIKQAQNTGADLIAVSCPLCHANLDARQFQMNLEEPIPVLFFTQLMALAMDLNDKASMLQKNLVDPRPLLRSKGVISSA
jgi:heterodisulfide reductase subunit B